MVAQPRVEAPSVIITETLYPVQVGSFENPTHRRIAASVIANGGIIGIQVFGACGILGAGDRPYALERTTLIKGKRQPRAAMVHSTTLRDLGIAHGPALHPHVLELLTNAPDELSKRVGCSLHLRLPVHPNTVLQIPSGMLSHNPTTGYHEFQNLDPTGHPIGLLIGELHEHGVQFPFVTSLNKSGEPTIVGREAGLAFSAQTRQIGLYMAESGEHMPGSFPIVHASDLVLLRTSRNPQAALNRLLAPLP